MGMWSKLTLGAVVGAGMFVLSHGVVRNLGDLMAVRDESIKGLMSESANGISGLSENIKKVLPHVVGIAHAVTGIAEGREEGDMERKGTESLNKALVRLVSTLGNEDLSDAEDRLKVEEVVVGLNKAVKSVFGLDENDEVSTREAGVEGLNLENAVKSVFGLDEEMSTREAAVEGLNLESAVKSVFGLDEKDGLNLEKAMKTVRWKDLDGKETVEEESASRSSKGVLPLLGGVDMGVNMDAMLNTGKGDRAARAIKGGQTAIKNAVADVTKRGENLTNNAKKTFDAVLKEAENIANEGAQMLMGDNMKYMSDMIQPTGLVRNIRNAQDQTTAAGANARVEKRDEGRGGVGADLQNVVVDIENFGKNVKGVMENSEMEAALGEALGVGPNGAISEGALNDFLMQALGGKDFSRFVEEAGLTQPATEFLNALRGIFNGKNGKNTDETSNSLNKVESESTVGRGRLRGAKA